MRRRLLVRIPTILMLTALCVLGVQDSHVSAAARSVHVVIGNQTNKTLVFVRGRVQHGEVTRKPPSRILPSGTGELFAESHGVMTGTEGSVAYRMEGVAGEATFHWDNPFSGSNSFSASAPRGFATGQVGGHGNRTVIFFFLRDAGQRPVNCNPQWIIRSLGAHAESRLDSFDKAIGFFTTPMKHVGISGWTATGCEAAGTGRPVRSAQHSTDGFWTIDVDLASFTVLGHGLADRHFVRIEVEPKTPAHAAAAARPPRANEVIRFIGHVLIDTHHGDELIEVHPWDPIQYGEQPRAYGPDTCMQGYVWREAVAGDHVCVTPATRTKTAEDNRRAGERRAGGGPYGPDTCMQGYVWREAVPNDHVCVTLETRSQARNDNSQAAARRAR